MKRTSLILISLFALSYVSAQVKKKVLADTITFITSEIKTLESLNYDQNTYRLNFEDCNLEYERIFKGEEDKYLIYDFWLFDIDEEQMSMDFAEGGWRIILKSPEKKIEYNSETGSGWVSEMHIYGKDQATLIPIGRALYFAIKSCKGLDRFKNR